jgi:hypothetical protein
MLKTTKTHAQDEAEILVLGHQGSYIRAFRPRARTSSVTKSVTNHSPLGHRTRAR